ncbi:ribonuclease HII [Thiobacter aerophilum]|uniref:Ribonuclease HII n=1 Tax=Thiobacter aerophilum TaxID=3121275 RepID=A0ABV0EAP2_9BURK
MAERLLVCGVDEAGRGPLAGPVYAAAVILDPRRPLAGLKDSKKLTPARRESLYRDITRHALAWAVARAEAWEIDRLDILQASLLAMQRALACLPVAPTHVRVDGNRAPVLPAGFAACVETIVAGDDTVAEISAASILAKVARDRALAHLDRLYPVYGFARHKGYPTKDHLQALRRHGACPEHRRSFAPVARVLAASGKC